MSGNLIPITYQGRILKPDGTALAVNTTFRFVIKSPDNCLLWQEDMVIDLTNTSGAFTANIGAGTNTLGGAYNFQDIFDNSKTLSGLTGCDSGTSYVPGATDDRTLFVSFNDGTGSQAAPSLAIKSVPFAQFASSSNSVKNLLGKLLANVTPTLDGQVLRYELASDSWKVGTTAGGVSSVGLDMPSSVFNVSAPVTGNGTLAATFVSQAQNTVLAAPATIGGIPSFRTLGASDIPGLAASQITAGTFATARLGVIPGANGGTVTQVNTGTGLTGGPFSISGTISLSPSGVTAGTYGNSSWIPSFVVDTYGRLTSAGSTAVSIDASQISSGTLATAVLGTLPVSSQWTNIAGGINYAGGSVGIGSSTPATKLDVNGAIKIANDSATCAAGFAGAIRYNGGVLEYCNGSGPGWIALGASGSGLQSLNGLVTSTQLFALGNSGTLAAFVSGGSLHTLNIPMASTSGASGGLISNSDYLLFSSGSVAASRISGTMNTAAVGTLPFTTLSGTISLAQRGSIDGSSLTNIAGSSITSGTINMAILGNIDAGIVTTGTFGLARVGNIPFAQVSGTNSVAQIGALNGSQMTAGTLNTSVVGALPFTSLSGTISLAQRGSIDASSLTNISASSITSGTLNYAQIGSLDASLTTSGTFGLARVGNLPFNLLTGTISVAQMGTINGSAITNIAGSSITSGTINWAILGQLPSAQLAGTLSSLNIGNLDAGIVTTGTFGLARVGTIPFAQVSGTNSIAQIGTLNGSQVSAGTLNTTVVGTLPFTSLSGTISLAQRGSIDASSLTNISASSITSGTLNYAQIGNLDASLTTSGTFGLARVGNIPFAQVSGTNSVAQIGALNGSQVTAGTLNTSVVGILPFTSLSGTISLAQRGSIDASSLTNISASSITSGTLNYVQIGNLDASLTTSGTFGLARIGNLPFNAVTGTISVAQMGTINGSAITNIAGSSVTSGTINWAILGQLPATQLAGTLNSTSIGNIPFAQVSGTNSVAQIGALNGSQVSTGTLNTTVVGTLPFTSLSGTISLAQRGSIDASSLTNISASSITSGTLNYAQIGSLDASLTTSGTFGLARVGNLPFNLLTGTISVAQMGTINGSAITNIAGSSITSGTINWAILGQLPSSQLAGTINTANIGNLSFTSLSGTISTAQHGQIPASIVSLGTLNTSVVGNLPFSSVTGTISVAQMGTINSAIIGNIPFAQVTGTNSVAQIGVLNGSQVTAGTLNTTVIGSVPFTSLNGTISTAQMGTINGSSINNIAGSSITSGTIAYAQLGTIQFSQVAGTISLAQRGPISVSAGTLLMANGSAALPSYSFASDPDTGVYSVGANTIGISTAGTLRVAVDALGNVGIGTATPLALLQIAPTSNQLVSTTPTLLLGSAAVASPSASGTYLALNAPTGYAGDFMNLQKNGSPIFLMDQSGKAYFYGNVTTENSTLYTHDIVMTGGSSQNFQNQSSSDSTFVGGVAIGTTSLSLGSKLQVNGGAITSGNGGEIRWMEQLTNGTAFVSFLSPANLATSSSWYLPATAGTVGQALTLSSAGSIGWSTISAAITYPLLSTTLGSVGTPAYSFAGDSDTGIFSPGAGTLAITTNGTVRLSVLDNGDIRATGTIYGFNSRSFIAADGLQNSPSYSFLNSPLTGFWTPSTEQLAISTFGTARIYISNTGNISMGTTANSLGTKLEVTGGAITSGNGGEVRLAETLTNGTSYVSLKAPAAIGSNTSWYLPATGGTVGQALTLSSAGSIGWSNVPVNGSTFLAANGSATAPGFAFNSDSDTGMYDIGANTLGISTAGTVRLAIDNLGYVGVGTTTPNALLNIMGGTLAIQGNAFTWGARMTEDLGSNFQIFVGGNERMRFLNTGELGVGTMNVSLGTKLEVTGGAITSGNGGEIRLAESLTNGSSYVSLKAPAALGSNTSWYLPATGGTVGQALTLGSTGSIGWATVPVNGSTFLAANGSATAPGFAFNSDPDTGIYDLGANTLGISTAGTMRIAIDNLGQVGIGTTTPLAQLQVNSTTTSTSVPRGILSAQISSDNLSGNFMGAKARGIPSSYASVANGDYITALVPLAYDGANFQYPGIAGFVVGNTPSAGSVPADFVVNTGSSAQGTERLRITSKGSVGIGTTSPSAMLEVAGGIQAGADTATCNATKAGTTRWTGTVGELCNGNNWVGITGVTSCPTGFTMVGDPGKRATFCIHTAEQTAASWINANLACVAINDTDLGRAHLCMHSEWINACQNAVGLTNITGNAEWVSDLSDPTFAWAAGTATCSSLVGSNAASTSQVYRCCIK